VAILVALRRISLGSQLDIIISAELQSVFEAAIMCVESSLYLYEIFDIDVSRYVVNRGVLHPCRYLNDPSIMIFQKLFVEPLILENIEISYINQMIFYRLWLMTIILRKHLAPE
jgi:hypothetical protein